MSIVFKDIDVEASTRRKTAAKQSIKKILKGIFHLFITLAIKANDFDILTADRQTKNHQRSSNYLKKKSTILQIDCQFLNIYM